MTQLVKDLWSFAYVMIVFLSAFAVGLWIIYHHYSGFQRNFNGSTISQAWAFDHLGVSLGTLFWGLLGYSSQANANVVIPEINVCIIIVILIITEHLILR